MTRWCIWCEMGHNPKSDYYYIHKDCFNDLMDFSDLGKRIFKEYDKKRHLVKEEIEELIKRTIALRKRWAFFDYIIKKTGREM